jgi:hypothetical protein
VPYVSVCTLPSIKLLTFSRFVRITKENGLNSCDELLLLLLAVRLNNRKTQKRGPYNRSHLLFGVDLGDIKPAFANARFLLHLCVNKQGNTTLWNRPADELGAGCKPVLDVFGAPEEILNAAECLDTRVRSPPIVGPSV